jgi:hypothetical protein
MKSNNMIIENIEVDERIEPEGKNITVRNVSIKLKLPNIYNILHIN